MLCIAGVVCVLQPWRESFNPTLTAIIFGYILTIICGITMSIEVLIVHHYPYLQKQDNQFVVAFWFCLSGGIISAIGSLAVEEITFTLSLLEWTLVLGHCVTYSIIILMFFYICTTIPGIIISLISSTSTLWMAGAQYTILYSIMPGNYNLLEFIGAGIVLASSLSALIIKAVLSTLYGKEKK